jgi:TolB protein
MMVWRQPCYILILAVGTAACGDGRPQQNTPSRTPAGQAAAEGAVPFPADPAEPHLANLQKLTHGGENAEAYFSADGSQLIFQAHRPGVTQCDQIFTMGVDGRNVRMVSTGKGRTTCSYFFPSGDRILYSSTHLVDEACPPPPDYSKGYVWALYPYDIFVARPDGSDLHRLNDSPGYDAEATMSKDGSRIVFTSDRDGDLEIYSMKPDGSDLRRLTHEPGYDGGPFYSADGTKIVYRAYHPETAEALADYRALLQEHLIRPTVLEIYVMDADGSNKRQLTHAGAASFAPYFFPDAKRIIFSSNMHDPQGRNFDLYMINVDGSGLERVTRHPDFDGFPMFSPDGSKLVFASNRGAEQPGFTNVFIADWVDDAPPGSLD